MVGGRYVSLRLVIYATILCEMRLKINDEI